MAWKEVHPKNGEHLKNLMEMEGARIVCQICDAMMWVQIDIEGHPILHRAGDIPWQICPQCTEIHKAAN